MSTQPYAIFSPENRCTSVVFASPHSGRNYASEFVERSILDAHTIRSSEDAFVDQLFAAAPSHGAPLVAACAPRAFLDLNRAHGELDPALIEGVRKIGHNPRVASGLGVIPRVVANGRAIYSGKMTQAEAEQRIAKYWHPYHAALQTLLDEARAQYGEAILIDCHSMPHEAVVGLTNGRIRRPEIVLGDRFGAAADVEIVDQIEAIFVEADFVVWRNAPFAGAYVTQHYGRPNRNQHAIQIEIDRSLYMDEAQIVASADFESFRTRLNAVIGKIAAIGVAGHQSLAAE